MKINAIDIEAKANQLMKTSIEASIKYTETKEITINNSKNRNLVRQLRKLKRIQRSNPNDGRIEIIKQLKKDIEKDVKKRAESIYGNEKSPKWSTIKRVIQEDPIQMEQFNTNRKILLDKFDEKIETIFEQAQTSGYGIEITKDELDDAIKMINSKAAAGMDRIRKAEFIAIYQEHDHQIYEIYKQLTRQAIFPSAWKCSLSVQIPKSDGIRVREIHVQSIFSKIYETIILNRIAKTLNKNFLDCQYAYQKDKSPIQLLMKIKNEYRKQNSHSESVMLIADIERAFDSISHDLILDTMRVIKMERGITQIINNFLKNRWVAIPDNQTYKLRKMDNLRGVPQGSGLGPMLFIIGFQRCLNLIKQIPPVIKTSRPFIKTTAMYADDLVISMHRTTTIIEKKQKWAEITLKYIKRITKAYEFEVLPEKTKFIAVTKHTEKELTQNENLKSRATILGMPFTYTVNNTFQIKDHIQRCTEKTKTLRLKTKWLKMLPTKLKMIILNSYNNSVYMYGAPLLLTQTIENQAQRKMAEKDFNHVFRTIFSLTKQEKREIHAHLHKQGAFFTNILQISLKYFLNEAFDGKYDEIYLDLMEKYPGLGPTIRSDKKLWGINCMIESITHNFFTERVVKDNRRIHPFWPKELIKTNKIELYLHQHKFILGDFDFLYNHKKICRCNSGSATPLHVLTMCPIFKKEIRYLRRILRIKKEDNQSWMLIKLEKIWQIRNLVTKMESFLKCVQRDN